MIISDNIFVMLLVEKFFKTFTNKEICDTTTDTEMIIALSAESRQKVDEMIRTVIEAGGKEYREPQDHACERLKKYARDELDRQVIEAELTDLKTALDLLT